MDITDKGSAINQINNDNGSLDDIIVSNLNFKYTTSDYKSKQVLTGITFSIPKGSRCLLIGANGAGKSTLLRVLAGRHMVPSENPDAVLVLGKRSFYQTEQLSGVTYLGGEWTRSIAFAGNSIPYQADIQVKNLSLDLQNKFPERKQKLFDVLEIDPEWKMHEVSDGQRRRVQIMLGLLRPFRVLLLDEMTVDLDVLARSRFLRYLRDECEHATILYATHIFDGMEAENWPTHLLYLENGKMIDFKRFDDAMKSTQVKSQNIAIYSSVSLYLHVTEFLEKMREDRLEAQKKEMLEKQQNPKPKEEKVLPFADRVNSGFTPGRMSAYLR